MTIKCVRVSRAITRVTSKFLDNWTNLVEEGNCEPGGVPLVYKLLFVIIVVA